MRISMEGKDNMISGFLLSLLGIAMAT
jgi:hypothetical protein